MYRRTRTSLIDVLRGSRSDRVDYLVTASIVLVVLLVIVNSLNLLGDVSSLLSRFEEQTVLFVLGALVAYLMSPLVQLAQRGVRARWAAIAGSYILLFLIVIVLGILLVNPFIHQARSLVNNLRNPAAANLQQFRTIRMETIKIQTTIGSQQQLVSNGLTISTQTELQTQATIRSLQLDLSALSPSSLPKRGQTQIPPSFVTPVQTQVNRLDSAYRTVMRSSGEATVRALDQALDDAKAAVSAASTSYKEAAATPILLNVQTWLDQHGIGVSLHDRFGSPLQQVSKQLSTILNNALSIAVQAGTLLLNIVLVLIISVYFVADGARFVSWCIDLAPMRARGHARYFVSSLDLTLGSYIRTQLLLATLAGTLDATGAVVFGVPYPIVIFFSTFFLSLIPVIGPIILYVPPMLIALLFTSFPTPLLYFPWLIIGEQLVTNVIGPRLQGHNVGIHPLVAMAAALLGYPIGGVLGAFFAVPIVAFLHIVVDQLVQSGRRDDGESGNSSVGQEEQLAH